MHWQSLDTHIYRLSFSSPGPDRSPRSCDMCLQNIKLLLLSDDRQKMIHSPETEFHFPRRATSIGWASLGPNRSLRSCDLQNFKFSDDSFAWDCQSFTSASTSLWMCPSNTSLLFTNPQVCSDFLTLLAAWEISRISVRNLFERDVCSQESREVSKSSIFSAVFRKHGHQGINLSHKSMRQSGSLVTRPSNVGRLSFIQDFSVGISLDILHIFTNFVGWKTSTRMEEFLN